MENSARFEIEKAAYDEFLMLWNQGEFQQQRVGQAFYNHFRLHQLSDQAIFYGLYESEGQKAMSIISRLFQLK